MATLLSLALEDIKTQFHSHIWTRSCGVHCRSADISIFPDDDEIGHLRIPSPHLPRPYEQVYYLGHDGFRGVLEYTGDDCSLSPVSTS